MRTSSTPSACIRQASKRRLWTSIGRRPRTDQPVCGILRSEYYGEPDGQHPYAWNHDTQPQKPSRRDPADFCSVHAAMGRSSARADQPRSIPPARDACAPARSAGVCRWNARSPRPLSGRGEGRNCCTSSPSKCTDACRGVPQQMRFHVFDLDRHALGGKATREQISILFRGQENGPRLDLAGLRAQPREAPARHSGIQFLGQRNHQS